MVKISDVAALAGVSASAVSRILSGDSTFRVSEPTRERVIDAVRALNYVPNHAGRALRTSRSNTIALLVPDVTSAVFAELASGAEEEAASRGQAIVLGRAERLGQDVEWLHRMLGEARVDGIVLQPADGTMPLERLALDGNEIPIVVINSVDSGPLSTIVLDDSEGIRTATDHLRMLGHTWLGFVGGLPGNATARRRVAGFREAATGAGLEPREEWMTERGYTGADGRAAIELLLTRGPLPTGLVVANLNAALGVLAAIHAKGLRVPADVSIVALHDVWYADATWPPITTVRMPLRELGAAAITRVVDRHTDVTHVTVDSPAPQLVLRQSTAPPSRSSA